MNEITQFWLIMLTLGIIGSLLVIYLEICLKKRGLDWKGKNWRSFSEQ